MYGKEYFFSQKYIDYKVPYVLIATYTCQWIESMLWTVLGKTVFKKSNVKNNGMH